jgi:hypothetical protein
MTRRTLQVNQHRAPSRKRSIDRPTCPSAHRGTSQRCVLDPGHLTRHFAAGLEWDDQEAAA